VKTWLVIDTIMHYRGKRKTIDFILREALTKSKSAGHHSSQTPAEQSTILGTNQNDQEIIR
jgi:hypothetical protein